jgi:hypothetical protein
MFIKWRFPVLVFSCFLHNFRVKVGGSQGYVGCISSFVLYKRNSYEAVGKGGSGGPPWSHGGSIYNISLVTHFGALEIKWTLGSSTRSLGGSI